MANPARLRAEAEPHAEHLVGRGPRAAHYTPVAGIGIDARLCFKRLGGTGVPAIVGTLNWSAWRDSGEANARTAGGAAGGVGRRHE